MQFKHCCEYGIEIYAFEKRVCADVRQNVSSMLHARCQVNQDTLTLCTQIGKINQYQLVAR